MEITTLPCVTDHHLHSCVKSHSHLDMKWGIVCPALSKPLHGLTPDDLFVFLRCRLYALAFTTQTGSPRVDYAKGKLSERPWGMYSSSGPKYWNPLKQSDHTTDIKSRFITLLSKMAFDVNPYEYSAYFIACRMVVGETFPHLLQAQV